jgi:hypothetical protein
MSPHRRARAFIACASSVASLLIPLFAPRAYAQTLNTTLLDAQSIGGLVNSAVASSRAGDIDNPFEAFGTSGPIEGGSFIFSDSIAGPDVLTFGTSSPVTLYGIRLQGGAGGPSVQDGRRILTATLSADGGLTSGPVVFDDVARTADLFFPSPVTGSSFVFTLVREDGAGTRISEIDAYVPEPTGLIPLCLIAAAALHRRRQKR